VSRSGCTTLDGTMTKAGSHGVAVGWQKRILIWLTRSPLAFLLCMLQQG
jgi:hypothetical protein